MNKYTYYYLNSTFSLDIENLSSIATRDWKSIYFKNNIFYLWPLYITAAPTNIITNEPSRLVEAKKAPNQRERRINFHSKIFPLFQKFCRIMLDMYVIDILIYFFSESGRCSALVHWYLRWKAWDLWTPREVFVWSFPRRIQASLWVQRPYLLYTRVTRSLSNDFITFVNAHWDFLG